MLSKGTFHLQNFPVMNFNSKFKVAFFVFLFVFKFWSSFCVLVVVIVFALKYKFNGVFSLLEAIIHNPSLECFRISLQLSLSQLFLIFFSSLISSYSTFTFSLSVSISIPPPPLSPHFPFPFYLTVAAANLAMCPLFLFAFDKYCI